MLVKWKILCTFGFLFWSTMCVIDYVFGNIINNGEFTKFQADEPFDEEDDTEYSGIHQIVIWGMFSFTASFAVCVLMKFLKQQIVKYTQEQTEVDNQQITTVSTVRLPTHSSGMAIKFEPAAPEKDKDNASPNLNLLEAVKDFPVTTESSEIATKQVEKRCAKLKEEMREMQMSTWKEYSSLNKKLDSMSKEKTDLGRQLQQSQRDNRQLKQQLDDVLSDRSLLIKRLECATKEIKLNTSSKQMTLDKLEEAVSCSNQMRSKMAQLSKERDDWEAKYKCLEDKYKTLKTSVKMSLDNRIIGQVKTVDVEAEAELEQSEKDIAKVQNKLMDLEKSLEKMRSSKPNNNLAAIEVINQTKKTPIDVENKKNAKEIECEEEKCDQSEKNHISKRTGDGLDVEKNTMDLSKEGTEIIPSTEEPSDAKTETTPTECVARTVSTPNSLSLSSTSSRTDESVLSVEESESDLMYPPGIVSQSPAFQRFLLKVLESPVV